MRQSKIGIIGAGAVGAVFAELLYRKYGDEVTALADEKRIENIKKEGGIIINGEPAQFPITPFCIFDDHPFALLILSVKGYQLKDALKQADACIGERTQIISLMNGITPVRVLADAYGTGRVPLAFTVGQDSVRKGYRIQWSNQGKIIIGENKVPSTSLRAEGIKHKLKKAGISCEVPYDMNHALWWKFMVNVGVNQVSAVLDAPYGEFQKNGAPRDMMLSAIYEVQHAARFEGVELSNEDVESWLSLLGRLNPEGETSMLQDVRAGRKTEVELFSGTMLSLGEKHGLDLPVNKELYRKLTEKGETS